MFHDADGRIVVVCRGGQTAASIRDLGRQVKTLAERSGAPDHARVLVDLAATGDADAEARRAGSEILHTTPFGRAGIFGAKPVVRHFTNLILLAARMSDRARVFGSREEATRWVDEIGAPAPSASRPGGGA